MEQHIDIKDLHLLVGKEMTGYYLVAEKELREGKQGNYLRMKLQDKSGSSSANIWNNADQEAQGFDEGDIIKIKANVISYKGQVQLTITKVRFADASEYNIEDFLSRSNKDPDLMAAAFFALVDKVENQYLNKLLKLIFEDKEFFAKFYQAPAAKSWHHSYLHGLIEHTVSVATICDFVSTQYPVNYDLLITGAILHDVAKVMEYSSKTKIDFTDIGRLIGHLSLSDQLVCETAAKINGFPEVLLINLRHLILSHHGEYEKASVRLPQTLEAVVLHLADNMDAQTVGVLQLVESAPPNADWTEFDRLNNRYYKIYRP
ncbi:MAG: 3'-5' exonuclease [Candidatus Cloacimonetes bacterium HGW-Cloacimonetes-1]|jgi:3'-5' exoribonuclease|nr:MAG: 3'-5' exonuclease [Candidatus Cloacimonetes bacterium HGW-Cloacimonetes-1]